MRPRGHLVVFGCQRNISQKNYDNCLSLDSPTVRQGSVVEAGEAKNAARSAVVPRLFSLSRERLHIPSGGRPTPRSLSY